MKTTIQNLICTCLAAGVSAGASQAAEAPDAKSAKKAPTTISGGKSPAAKAAASPAAKPKEEATLRLNFRGAPLETVLNYLSDAAGFTINMETAVRGTVDVWNNQPMTKSEAVDVLNAALNKNGYAAIQSGKMLTIMTLDAAKKRNTPVKTTGEPEEIPDNGEVVTQIMPVTHVNAAQLIRDLGPILPSTGTMVANEAGNSIIITDTQANIRHLAEIVKAIDTSISSISGIKVFPLKYADSKSVTAVIKELFATDSSSGGSSRGGTSPFGGFTSRFGGGGFPGGGGGFPGGGGGFPGGGRTGGPTGGTPGSRTGTGSGGRGSAAAKVVAVADDRSNSVVVTAPDDVMPTVEQLIESVDVNVEDVTELKVFHLKYADPTEMAELLSNLFPDESKTSSSNNSRFGSPFGGFTPFGGGTPGGGRTPGGGGGSSNLSDRAKKQGKVIAVPDSRTASVVVTTSHDLMRQIETMVERLDSDPSRKQKVFVYSLENADAQQVQQILQDLFQTQQTSRNNRNQQQNSPLSTRTTQQQNQSGQGNNIGGSQLGRAPNTGGGGN
jgi:general secretion pathway protein D